MDSLMCNCTSKLALMRVPGMRIILPTDLPDKLFCHPPVRPFRAKYFASRLTQITGLSPAIPSHERGVSRSSRTLGAGCDGRNGARGRTALIADGEVVWS